MPAGRKSAAVSSNCDARGSRLPTQPCQTQKLQSLGYRPSRVAGDSFASGRPEGLGECFSGHSKAGMAQNLAAAGVDLTDTGAVHRVPSDVPINQRGDLTRYPPIPAGNDSEDIAAPQLGCSAPLNNALPSAVASCAYLITQFAIDVLTERFDLADDVLRCLSSCSRPHFDHVGRVNEEPHQRVRR